jgi:pimeloyl-ACP methyl ester carboxylesterase
MWYDVRGEGDPLVLLHGGLTDSREFTGNLDGLAPGPGPGFGEGGGFRLFLPERRGHGHTPDVPGPITLEAMAQDTIAFLETIVGGPATLTGYSAGAMVALRVAARRPDLVERAVLISCAFHAGGMILRPTAGAEPPPPLAAAYAEVSPDGADHFPVVVGKIAQAVEDEPGLTADQLGAVTCPVLVMAADDDIVTLEHTLELYRGLRDAELSIVPGTSHLLLLEKPELCTRLVGDFLTNGSSTTLMPFSRPSRAG